MSTYNFDLERLLDPISVETFFNEYWEKKPLLLTNRAPEYYFDLMTMHDVDTLVESYITAGGVRTVKGNLPPYTNYFQPTMPALNQTYAAYQDGYTIVVDDIAKRHKPFGYFSKALESVLNYPVQSNLYLTPANSQAFDAHFDTHDVFILQIEGAKRWFIYDDFSEKLPLKGKARPIMQKQLPAEPLYDTVLRAGDLLYMPRGFVHYAQTHEEMSLHVTVGIHNIRWADLIAQALNSLTRRDVRLRESVPPGFLNQHGVSAEMEARFLEIMETFVDCTNLQAGVDVLRREVIFDRPPVPDGHFAQLEKINTITLDTVLEQRGGLLNSVKDEGRTASIMFSGNTLRGPRKILPALEYVSGQQQFTARDLPELNDDEKLMIARSLIKEGFARIQSVEVAEMVSD